MTLITEEYRRMNAALHESRADYGTSLSKWVPHIAKIVKAGDSVLNYGCGKSFLRADFASNVVNYDPAIPGYDALPQPADVVICTEVLEHVEPDCLDAVLDHLQSLTKRVAFLVIPTMPAKKFLADGRNAHLIQQKYDWWLPKFHSRFFIRELHNTNYFFVLIVENGTKAKSS